MDPSLDPIILQIKIILFVGAIVLILWLILQNSDIQLKLHELVQQLDDENHDTARDMADKLIKMGNDQIAKWEKNPDVIKDAEFIKFNEDLKKEFNNFIAQLNHVVIPQHDTVKRIYRLSYSY